MFQTRYWNVILLLLATIWQGFGREPVCSKFHYEEQLLEKMIRQEINVQKMETEIKEKLDNMEEKINNNFDELKRLADKVDIPRVSFNVYNVNDINVVKKEHIFIFTNILLNIGNGYDSNTGIFSAPVAGLYHFTAHVCNYHEKYVHYGITVDNETVAASVQSDKDRNTCSSISTVVMLNDGSRVWVRTTYSSANNMLFQHEEYRRVSFVGVLVRR